jgi:hypothetical protein
VHSVVRNPNIINPIYALGVLPSTVGSRFLNIKLYHEISNLTQNIYIESINRSLEDYVLVRICVTEFSKIPAPLGMSSVEITDAFAIRG